MEVEDFQYIFNNVIFPPKLPQTGEQNEWKQEEKLLSFVMEVARSFIKKNSAESATGWSSVMCMLQNLEGIMEQGSLSEEALLDLFKNLAESSE